MPTFRKVLKPDVRQGNRRIYQLRQPPAAFRVRENRYRPAGHPRIPRPHPAVPLRQTLRVPPDRRTTPEVKALAEELSVIHLPEWRSEVGRKLAEPTVTSIKQAVRVAEYLVKRGVRVHPDLEEIRWTPTPGGQPGVFDTALHLTKDATGNWPAPDPEVFYNLEDIQVTKTDDGLWSATHPRGLATEAPTKTDAYAALVDQLRARIDQARQARDE